MNKSLEKLIDVFFSEGEEKGDYDPSKNSMTLYGIPNYQVYSYCNTARFYCNNCNIVPIQIDDQYTNIKILDIE